MAGAEPLVPSTLLTKHLDSSTATWPSSTGSADWDRDLFAASRLLAPAQIWPPGSSKHLTNISLILSEVP